VSPTAAVFEDVAEDHDNILAVGNKTTAAGVAPYAVKVDNETWEAEELVLPPLPGRTISGVYNLGSNNAFWLLLSDHDAGFYGKHAGVAALCWFGDFKSFEFLGPVTAWVGGRGGDFYALEYAGDTDEPPGKGPGYNGRGRFYITTDYGDTWHTELFPANFGDRSVHAAEIVGYWESRIYIKVLFKDGATGLAWRSTDVNGSYMLVFVSYAGPYFQNLVGCVGQTGTSDSWDLSEGIGVGTNTTVVFQGGAWSLERFTLPLDFVGVDAYFTGYLGLGRDYFGWGVYTHP
jgi:hypothetical protein